MRTIRLTARRHAEDWLARCEAAEEATVIGGTARTITLELTDAALEDLIADATYYAEEMGPDNTEDLDYRPAARACLRALVRAGVTWSRRPRTFQMTLTPTTTTQEDSEMNTTKTGPTGPCPCECNSGGFCGGCGHAGCGGR